MLGGNFRLKAVVSPHRVSRHKTLLSKGFAQRTSSVGVDEGLSVAKGGYPEAPIGASACMISPKIASHSSRNSGGRAVA